MATDVTEEEREVFRKFCDKSKYKFSDFKEVNPPDFVQRDGSIAVELVKYHSDIAVNGSDGSLQRRAEETFKILVKKAHKYFLEQSTQKINAYFFMNNKWRDRKKETSLDALAGEIASLALKHQGKTIKLGTYDLPESLRGVLGAISFNPSPQYTASRWQYVAAAFSEALPEAVRRTIQNKEPKLSHYKQQARRVALLIYSSPIPCVGGSPDQVSPSTCGTITNELRKSVFKSSFDEIYYLDGDQEELVQLKTKPL
jgi:hypothetical protein